VRYLAIDEVLKLHERIIAQSGGSRGIRDHGAIEASIAQPQQTFEGRELYPSLTAKAAALGYFLVRNHPFIDGNKRVGHAALEVVLVLNGLELAASIDEQEQVILTIAVGNLSREDFTRWVEAHVRSGRLTSR
jgi:death-on-curing protein